MFMAYKYKHTHTDNGFLRILKTTCMCCHKVTSKMKREIIVFLELIFLWFLVWFGFGILHKNVTHVFVEHNLKTHKQDVNFYS